MGYLQLICRPTFHRHSFEIARPDVRMNAVSYGPRDAWQASIKTKKTRLNAFTRSCLLNATAVAAQRHSQQTSIN